MNKRLSDAATDPIFQDIRIIAIVRDHRTLIPRGDTYIRNNDHVFFISNNKSVDTVKDLVQHKEKEIHDVMLIGGDDLAYSTAKELEQD